jgi:hypothetical protein
VIAPRQPITSAVVANSIGSRFALNPSREPHLKGTGKPHELSLAYDANAFAVGEALLAGLLSQLDLIRRSDYSDRRCSRSRAA